MCGIVGVVNLNGSLQVDRPLLKKMCDTLSHRGPDDYGLYLGTKAALGHRRLSIIDLSEVARQPMSNEDDTLWIVFNGEIYNFRGIKNELKERGHRFKTNSDTEVILHAYEEYGKGCVDKFIGMFAFAIWDERKEALFVARDRVGKKPLYYSEVNGSFLFASEIKAILEFPWVQRRLNPLALDYYLAFQYVPSPLTMFEGIKKLPPAHCLTYTKKGITIKQYWRCTFPASAQEPMDESEAEKKLESLLLESVNHRLVSDVPVGAFLSGGIDSSLVVAMMSKMSREKLRTFTIGFKEDPFNELPFSREIANRFNTDHHEFIVSPKVIEVLPKLIWHYNEPFGDSSAIPTYYISKITSNYVKVAVSGDGGDELFGGYTRYSDLKRFMKYDTLAHPSTDLLQNIIGNISSRYSKIGRILNGIKIRTESTIDRNLDWITIFNYAERSRLYLPTIREMIPDRFAEAFYKRAYYTIPCNDPVTRIMFNDVFTYLPDDLLVKVDVASMANSLEVRCPILDHRIIEFSASLPSNLKVNGTETKIILKKVASRYLPESFMNRRKKGFSIPINQWIRKDLRSLRDNILLEKGDNTCGKFFNKDVIENILKQHDNEIGNHGTKIWLILNFVLWHKMFIEGEDIQPYFSNNRS